jgi:uncharacterized protein (DUF58 family)
VLTPRGWAALAAGVGTLITGHLFGLKDVFVVGIGLLVMLGAAVAFVHLLHPQVSATRRVLPARVHAGASSRVELALVNDSRHRTPVLTVRDPFDDGARWARFLVAPLQPTELARAAYRLPTEQRGIFHLGPLEIRLVDPFGLAATTTFGAPKTSLTVYPKIDRIAPLPTSHGEDPLAGAHHPHALSGAGEDFYALRPYVRGDDLRRVHWPSTARTDELMIRQDQMPWQGRTTIVVDVRATVVDDDSIERVLSAAASIVTAAWLRRSLVRLLTTAGYDSAFAAGRVHMESILEHLAEATADDGNLVRLLVALRRAGSGGALSMVTTDQAPVGELEALTSLRARYGSATLVVFETRSRGQLAAAGSAPPGTNVVRVGTDAAFASAWTAVHGPPTTVPASAVSPTGRNPGVQAPR